MRTDRYLATSEVARAGDLIRPRSRPTTARARARGDAAVDKDEKLGRSVLEEPEVWGVEAFGPDGVAIRLVIKTRPADQWKVMRELPQRMKEAFDEEGIEIPSRSAVCGSVAMAQTRTLRSGTISASPSSASHTRAHRLKAAPSS